MATDLHPAAASAAGQAGVLLAGLAGAAAVITIGLWLIRRTRAARPPGGRLASRLAAWTGALVGARDDLGRRTDPVIAAGLVLVAGIVLTLGIAAVVGRLSKLGVIVAVDRPLDMFVDGQRLSSVNHVMLNGTLLGSYEVCYTIAVVTGLIVGAMARRWLPLLVMLVALPVEIEIQKLAKVIVHGTEPTKALALGPPGAFFSGGSARTLIICGLVAYFAGWIGVARDRRGLLWTAAALATFIEGYSRLYLGRHWAVDIVSGWLIGGLILATLIGAAQALRPDDVVVPERAEARGGRHVPRPETAGPRHRAEVET